MQGTHYISRVCGCIISKNESLLIIKILLHIPSLFNNFGDPPRLIIDDAVFS